MIWFIKMIKLKRSEKLRKQAEEVERLKIKAQYRIDLMTERMLSKSCPMRNDMMCDHRCVHFRAGKVGYYYSVSGSWIGIDPWCKLWGR